ncbi:MAG: glycoside hydrolase family 9 protein, partial [Paludibacteraceae bacterium]|nr:glycoside hydrolase family 9 protein [Paludibacteraceae bacterium]
KNVFGLHLEKAKGDKNGFPYYSSRWGTNKLALGGATVAALYVKLVEDGVITSSRNIEEAKGFRDRIVDYVMGKNEFNHTFLHGFKGDMHFRLHHRNAMGRNDNPPSNVKNSCEYMFASGGVIGGPSGTGIFENVVEGGASYTETEGGCDYNAPFIAAIASVVEKLDPDPTGVEEVRNTSFSVYPTVIDDYVIVDPIEIGYDGRAEISIVNINGQTVAAESMIGFTPTVIYTSSLPRGIYVLKVNFDGGQKTYKLIKE